MQIGESSDRSDVNRIRQAGQIKRRSAARGSDNLDRPTSRMVPVTALIDTFLPSLYFTIFIRNIKMLKRIFHFYVTIKVNVSLRLIEHHAKRTYGDGPSEGVAPWILNYGTRLMCQFRVPTA